LHPAPYLQQILKHADGKSETWCEIQENLFRLKLSSFSIFSLYHKNQKGTSFLILIFIFLKNPQKSGNFLCRTSFSFSC